MKRYILTLSMVLIGIAVCRSNVFAQVNASGTITAAAATCPTAGACVTLTTNPSNATVAVQIAGTFSGTLVAEGTTDGTNVATVECAPIAGGPEVTSFTAAGLWQCASAGLNLLQVRASTFASGTASVYVQASLGPPSTTSSPAGTASPVTSNVTDPNLVFSGAINIASAANTQIIALSGTKSIYVTAYGLTIAASIATAQTVTFVQGTGSNCATGTTAITGALSGDTIDTLTGDILPVVITGGDGTGALFKAPAGKALCIQTTGVQPVGGWVSAVQFFYMEDAPSEADFWSRKLAYRRRTIEAFQ